MLWKLKEKEVLGRKCLPLLRDAVRREQRDGPQICLFKVVGDLDQSEALAQDDKEDETQCLSSKN